MVAALFRLNCNSTTFTTSPGDLFLHQSGDGINAYAYKMTPNVASGTVSVISYDESATIYVYSQMTGN